MASTTKRGVNVFGILKKVILAILVLGVLVAVMRAFDWDVFGVVDWIWTFFSGLVMSVADFLTGRSEFQQIVKAP